MSNIFTKEIKVSDLCSSMLILFIFSSLFLVCNYYVLSKGYWQRYEVYILRKNSDLICDLCGKDNYANRMTKILKKINPAAEYSVLYPVWADSRARLVSFSVFSKAKIKIPEIYNAVVKYEKCQGELVKVDDISNYKIEGFGRLNESEKGCKVYLIYERKL